MAASRVGGSPVGPRELARRERDLRTWIGRQILEARLEHALARRAVARAVGIDESHLWRIEAGQARASLHVIVSIAACLGSELGVRLFPVSGPRLVDRFQAPILEALVRQLHPDWRSSPEVPVPRARGVIDLVLERQRDRLVVACECHSELRRLELVVRRANEKAVALRDLGEDAERSQLLILRSTVATREAARTFGATLGAAYPARTRDAFRALTEAAPWPGSAIVWARLDRGEAEILDAPPRGVPLGR